MLLINCSGHPAPMIDVDGNDIDLDVVDIDVPNLDIPNASFQDVAHDLMNDILDNVDKDVLMRGNFQVMLPGLTPLAVSLLTLLHGFIGHFPSVRSSVRVDGGFRLSDPIDLFQVRLDGRDLR